MRRGLSGVVRSLVSVNMNGEYEYSKKAGIQS